MALRKNIGPLMFYALLVGLGGLITWVTYNYLIIFSDFGLIMLFLAVCIGIYHAFDSLVLHEIDFITEIQSDGRKQQGNIAYALVLVAIAIVILAGAITVG
ncbi:hypothetical protein [Fodinibius salinus]|nr:hypothetical protein [Fodinibius salinus]